MQVDWTKYQEYVQDIQGKPYMTVAGRIKMFWDNLPDGGRGMIVTEQRSTDPKIVEFRAEATILDGTFPGSIVERGTGHASEIVGGTGVNRDSALENCETSAVGRALGMLGLGLISKGGVASADEVRRAMAASEERSSGAVSEARQRPADAPAGLPETGGPQGQGDGHPRKGEGSYSTPEDAEYPHCGKCGKEVTTTRKAGENAQRPGELFYSCWSKDGCKNGFIIYCDEWEKVKAGRKAKIIAGDFTPASKESQPKAADPDYSLFEKRGLVKCPHCDSVMMNVESDKLTEQGWEPSAIRENRYWACVQEDCVAAHNGDFRSWAKKPGGDK